MYGDDCTEEQSPNPVHGGEPMYWCSADDIADGGVGAGGIVLIVLAVLVVGAVAGYCFIASKRRSDDKKNPKPASAEPASTTAP